MWEPVGPLPARVYWRRRLMAIAGTVAVLAGCAWLVAALLVPVARAVGEQVAGPVALAAGAADRGEQPADPAAVPVPAASPPAAHPDGDAATERLQPDDAPRRVGPAPTPVPVPSTGPGPCENATLGVAAEIDRPAHRVGERPVLRLVVTNRTHQPCVRDLDPARQEIVVWGADGSRLWSSNDCSTAAGTDLRTLVPGQPVVFSVTWAGRTSTPGCAGARTTVPAGSYTVLTRVDDVISGPARFTRTP
jgi:hypothetical protein